MIKRIIFLVEARFNLRDHSRFGIEILENNGFNVEIWDLSSILHPEYFQRYLPFDVYEGEALKVFNNEGEMLEALSRLSSADFIMNFVSYNFGNLRVYRALSKSKANYAVLCANALPVPIIKKCGIYLLIAMLKRLASFRYSSEWKRLFMRLPSRWLRVKPVNLILAGGENCFNYRNPIDKYTEILKIHTLDYDLYLKERGGSYVEKPFIVYLDSFLPFHPDYIMSGEKAPIDADRYYPLLNNFFDYVEKETGLEVVIAAHPRSYYEKLPDYFSGRKCIKNNTAALIKECRFVIGEFSTAFNLANLFNKPAIFITSSHFENTWEMLYIREMAKWFGKEPIFIDNNSKFDLEKELTVSRDHYDKYRRAYIKTDNSEIQPFWQIVADRCKGF